MGEETHTTTVPLSSLSLCMGGDSDLPFPSLTQNRHLLPSHTPGTDTLPHMPALYLSHSPSLTSLFPHNTSLPLFLYLCFTRTGHCTTHLSVSSLFFSSLLCMSLIFSALHYHHTHISFLCALWVSHRFALPLYTLFSVCLSLIVFMSFYFLPISIFTYIYLFHLLSCLHHTIPLFLSLPSLSICLSLPASPVYCLFSSTHYFSLSLCMLHCLPPPACTYSFSIYIYTYIWTSLDTLDSTAPLLFPFLFLMGVLFLQLHCVAYNIPYFGTRTETCLSLCLE